MPVGLPDESVPGRGMLLLGTRVMGRGIVDLRGWVID